MDIHCRRGIFALVLLSFVAILFANERTRAPLPDFTPVEHAPFAGHTPSPTTSVVTEKKEVIFTFDGGEGTQSASEILDSLKSHDARAVFFLTGKWMLRNSELVRRIHSDGHEIYNHTFSHPYLISVVNKEIAAELNNTDSILIELIGTSSKPYFRPPYGEYDQRVLDVAARNGYRAVMWTVDAGDWMEDQGFSDGEILGRIYSGIAPGAIILMHIGDQATGRLLDEILTEVERRGYSITTLRDGV